MRAVILNISLILSMLIMGCAKKIYVEKEMREKGMSIIPKPQKIEPGVNDFRLTPSVQIIISDGDGIKALAYYFKDFIHLSTGWDLTIRTQEPDTLNKAIIFKINENPDLGMEGYILDITEKYITITT